MEERYGVPLKIAGVNQHTWHSSSRDSRQSLLSVWRAGLLWNSGFAPANNADSAPQVSAQAVVSLPFFMTENGERTLLVQNCSTLLYSDASWTDISAKYGVPMLLYYHCDFAYNNEDRERGIIQIAEDFRRAKDYNFTREDQLMLQTAAAYNLDVTVEKAADGDGFVISPLSLSRDFPLYDERYQGSCGIRISVGEALKNTGLAVDADVCYNSGGDIYAALNRPITVKAGVSNAARISRINIAARVTMTDNGAQIAFLDDGLMEIAVSGGASTDAPDWEVRERGGFTVFTKFGTAETIKIDFS
jgi:hypothetical protein